MLIYGGLAIVVLGCSSGEMATTRSRAKKRMRDEREVTDDGLPNLVMLYRKFNEELFNNRIPSSFTIAWGRRMTRVSGVMIPGERRIKISLPIHSRLGKDELYDTIIHEMIHAFLYLSNVYHGHGKHFLNEAARIYRLSGRKITPWHDGRGMVAVWRELHRYGWRCGCGYEAWFADKRTPAEGRGGFHSCRIKKPRWKRLREVPLDRWSKNEDGSDDGEVAEGAEQEDGSENELSDLENDDGPDGADVVTEQWGMEMDRQNYWGEGMSGKVIRSASLEVLIEDGEENQRESWMGGDEEEE